MSGGIGLLLSIAKDALWSSDEVSTQRRLLEIVTKSLKIGLCKENRISIPSREWRITWWPLKDCLMKIQIIV